jgi:cyclopropane fatty-acyl-phospholipid synthase-like methyltransferase
MSADTFNGEYFRALYARDPDPWRFATSAYEQDKYQKTLSALSKARYADAFEVGCSIGVLTRMLADRCDRLLAVDVASAPLVEARRRCLDVPWASFAEMAVPEEWPSRRFDLIVLSEVVYYLSRGDVLRLSDRIRASFNEGGDLLLVHWTGPTNYPLTGDEAAECLLENTKSMFEDIRGQKFEGFRLDIARRANLSA